MAFNVQEFRASLLYDGARPSLFDVSMTVPALVAFEGVNRQITFRAKATELPADSILIADYTIYMPLTFELKVQKKRNDVSLVFSESLLNTGLEDFYAKNRNRRIFLATDTPASYYGISKISPNFTLKAKGVIFELIKVVSDNT